jgi:hypothetical protein
MCHELTTLKDVRGEFGIYAKSVALVLVWVSKQDLVEIVSSCWLPGNPELQSVVASQPQLYSRRRCLINNPRRGLSCLPVPDGIPNPLEVSNAKNGVNQSDGHLAQNLVPDVRKPRRESELEFVISAALWRCPPNDVPWTYSAELQHSRALITCFSTFSPVDHWEQAGL